jgi:hypothetical protein
MTDHSVDDLLSDLKTALDVTPSAGFAAGVRMRIAGERTRAHGWTRWWPLAAAAAVAVSVAIAVVVRSQPSPHSAVDRPASVAAAAPIAVDAPVASVSAPAAPVTSTTSRVARSAPPHATGGSASEPALEVITNQAAVLQTLWARARTRGNALEEVEPRTVDDAPADAMREIVVPQVTIEPIVISALGNSGGAAQGPSVDRSTIRRVQAGRE